MAKNITLLGASYSDVPAVTLPQTGGGTARFDDCSVVTAVASDVAQGKIFVANDGTITTGTASGGGGLDMPTFTITYSSDYSSIVSVACDKTYAECLEYFDNYEIYAQVIMTAQGDTYTYSDFARATFSEPTLIYTIYAPYPVLDICYNGNTITTAQPSRYAVTLNVTENGTYTPLTPNIYTEVNVSVPQPSGSINITQNGTVDVTNYASAVVNVSGGGTDFIVTITQNQNDEWTADKTFSEVLAAHNANKNIAIEAYMYGASSPSPVYIEYSSESNSFLGTLMTSDDGVTESEVIYDSTGLYVDSLETYRWTGDATAVSSDVANGKIFYNANGRQTGTNSGGGGSSKNAQTAQSTSRSTSSTYTEVIRLTCTKAGTYNVYWSTFRSSTSGTWGSQLYLNDTAYGSAQTGSWSNHIQNIHLSNVQIDANEEVAVRVRSRGSNYYGYVGTLTIIEV